jgi:hypothetical protein
MKATKAKNAYMKKRTLSSLENPFYLPPSNSPLPRV